MRALIASIALALFLGGCAAGGGLRPTIFTSPPSYLASFPLGQVSEAQVKSKIGPPDSTTTIDGHKALVYVVGEGYGRRKFTYIIDHGVVADVRYNDSGPYNGITARGQQGK